MFIPLHSLPKLKISAKKKLALYGLFAAGIFSMVSSIMRCVMAIVQPDLISPVLLWSTVEETVSLLVANAPVLRILVFKGMGFITQHSSNNGPTTGRLTTLNKSTTHDDYEMVPKGGPIVSVISSPRDEKRGKITRDNTMQVLRTVEVQVHAEELKRDDASSAGSSTWVP
jgi:hypothetical protein